MNENPRILIIRTDRIGDVVLSTPVIRALRAAFPHAYLGMMVRPENRELVEGNPDLDAVILYDKQGAEKGIAGNLRFARRLRERRFDTAVVLHSTNRVILVSWLAGIRRRVGYARRMGWLLTHRLPYVKREGQRHELEYNLHLLRLIGVEAGERELFVPTRAQQQSRVEQLLRQQGLEAGAPLVVLHPGASCPSKRWPAERFAQVGDRLAARGAATVAVLTGAGEEEHGRAVLRQMRQPAIDLTGAFGLGETASLLKRARLLVSNDSGPVHLACAVGTPVVSIFGRWGGGLSPTRWGPTGRDSVTLHHDIGCRPCLAHRCTIGFKCLEAVTVEEVVAAADHLMGRETNAS
ncbi:MAG: lipopolysaccharide heptosyltransferase II [Candidatus Omnitrophica bacterium]|nr:lipopolysaccharide heptosyltransferase II [Candidatus Omnitrophota bacterium]